MRFFAWRPPLSQYLLACCPIAQPSCTVCCSSRAPTACRRAGLLPAAAVRLASPQLPQTTCTTRLRRLESCKRVLVAITAAAAAAAMAAAAPSHGSPAYRTPLPGERFFYGGLSCVIAAVITNPLDGGWALAC